jgi:hypothetical protein
MQTAFHRWRTGAEPRSDGKRVEVVSAFHEVKMKTAFHRWRTGAEPRSDGTMVEAVSAFHNVNFLSPLRTTHIRYRF